MVNNDSLGALEETQEQERAAARRRIDEAEEYVDYYRSRINHVQESFYELASRVGVLDDPGFRSELQRISDETDENVREAGQTIAELEADYWEMTTQHSADRELFIERQRSAAD
jgi:hemerythrin-like domain-containing protein